MAEGGVNVALGNVDPQDNWEVHFKDTVTGGAYLNNQKLVEILVKEGPERLFDLEEYGVVFDRTQRQDCPAAFWQTDLPADMLRL